MRALVTGGAGFIGSAFCRQAIEAGWTILNLDKLTYASNLASLSAIAHHDNYKFVHGDICDRDLIPGLLQSFKPEIVVHFAAESHVDRSITSSQAFIETNIVGTHALLDAALKYWDGLASGAKQNFRFLHVSTDEVFGSLGDAGSFNESTPYDPRSPYSSSKAASDHLVRAWWHTYGLPTVVSNCSNNYGPYQFPEKLIPLVLLNALEGRSLPVYGDGKNVRDWLFVDDHVAALMLLAKSSAAGETYCVGGRSERSNIDVVRAICALVDEAAPSKEIGARDGLIEFVADRPGHDRRYAIDASKIETELNWRPRETFETGLRRTVRWYLANPGWWAPIRADRYQGQRLGLKTHHG